ncbi:MAG: type II restriction endonuclease subunit M, partial [Oenococcus sp.]
YYFREAITWPKITSGNFNIRYRESGSIHDTAGNEAFSRRHEDILYALALCGTKVADLILSILNPTINVQVGDFSNIPVLFSKDQEEFSTGIVQKLINTSKEDWDAFEISWDFKNLPMLSHIAEHNRNWTVEEAFNTWSNEAESRFENLKSNEEELNRIFIDLYGLQDELTLEVADKDVSIRRADKARDIKAFLSYFVGVVFGRYSLDNPGLAFAGGTWDSGKYTNFHPNEDDVILLTDEDYFGDNRDIIGRLKEFLATTFGADHLSQNLAFIANALGKKGDSAEKQIRSYFINDFYKQDHLSIYQKKPIYWQLDSGKRAGFRALFYLHRYDENTMAMIRTKYLHPLQAAYQSRRGQLQNMVKTEVTLKSKNQLVKRIEQLTQQLEELAKYDVILQHVANQHIALDLDDGVLVNHEKVQGGEKILTPIK